MPNVKPEIMRWARDTAGLSPAAAVAKLQLRAARGKSATERLLALESGDDRPTRPMLVKMARVYRRPLLTFYLSRPPVVVARGEDFRTLPEAPDRTEEALLDALMRNVRARQAMVRDILEDDDDLEPLPFIGSMTIEDGVRAVRESIRDVLGVDVAEFRATRTLNEAFGMLRDAAEEVGVFVLLVGDLGSHHTALDTTVFRGIALSDEIAPFVVMNPDDSKAARSFTLLHELAHLWLGLTGVSGGGFPALRAERFCNEVASTYLLPESELAELATERDEDLMPAVAAFARERNISASMVSYRLYKARRIDQGTWQRLRDDFHDRWVEQRAAAREQARARGTGPGYYQVRRHRVGSALVEFVRRTMRAGDLTTTKAGTVLGVKPKNVAGLVAR